VTDEIDKEEATFEDAACAVCDAADEDGGNIDDFCDAEDADGGVAEDAVGDDDAVDDGENDDIFDEPEIAVLAEDAVTVVSRAISHATNLHIEPQVGAFAVDASAEADELDAAGPAAVSAAPAAGLPGEQTQAKGLHRGLIVLIAVVVCVALVGVAAFLGVNALRNAATAPAAQDSESGGFDLEECDVSINFNLPLDGADVTPFVVKIEGTNALGGAFSQTYLAQPAQEFAATLPLGEYTLTFETSPIFANGAIWDVSQMRMHFLVQTVSDTLPQTDGSAPTFTQIAAQDVPAETVVAMRQALIAAGAPEADAAAYVERITSAQDAYARAAQIQSWVGGYYTETPVQGAEINPFYQVCINGITDGTVTLSLYRADAGGQWYNCVTGITAPLDEATNSVSFSYAQDEYGQSGKGKIVFGEGYITITVDATMPAGEASSGTFDTASAATSGTLTLESGFASVFDAANIVVTTGTQDAA
jgi:hypothetical protein